jgi:hypothetical protein
MTQTTNDQQRMEAAVTGVTAKWERFSDGLTPDERTVLSLALREVQAGSNPPAEDVAGHDYAIDLARRYVNAMPIWDTLQKAIADMTRPINWNP